ncbi:MAG: hypothetical protein JXB05_35640 [Myxococcaceae bacterium]|nr:hypothetical protein [Myxococcaceae bacterium]
MTPPSDQQESRFNATAIAAPAIETPRFLKIVSTKEVWINKPAAPAKPEDQAGSGAPITSAEELP